MYPRFAPTSATTSLGSISRKSVSVTHGSKTPPATMLNPIASLV